MNELDVNFYNIIKIVETRKNNAFRKVNEETIKMYWEFGEYVSNKLADSEWGEKIVTRLAEFMQKNYPTFQGFNKRGLDRMKQFYETYKYYPEIVSTVLTQINWSSHIALLSETKTIEQKEFYIKLAVKEKYSTRELTRKISSSYYKRYMLSNGKNFTFVGEEYRIQVVNQDPSVGVILCANKDDEVVEYAMSRSMSPTIVSEYKLKLIDKKLLENKLKEILTLGYFKSYYLRHYHKLIT